VSNLGSELWQSDSPIHSLRVVHVQYVARCEFKRLQCDRAQLQIEVRNGLGISFWQRDYCEAHAQPVLERARAARLRIFD